jgi:hypothetical protein
MRTKRSGRRARALAAGTLLFGIMPGMTHARAETPAAPAAPAPAATAPAATPATARAARDPSRRVPRYFGQLGITPAQREAIYAIRAKEYERVNALKDQIAEAQDKAIADCEAVLTGTQMGALKQRRATALTAAGERRMAKAVKPTTK